MMICKISDHKFHPLHKSFSLAKNKMNAILCNSWLKNNVCVLYATIYKTINT
jgi:hypothetical protein